MKKLSLLFLGMGLLMSCTKKPSLKLNSNGDYSASYYNCSESILGEWELVRVLDVDSTNVNYYVDTIIYSTDTSQWWNSDSINYFNILSTQSDYPRGIYSIDCEKNVLTIGEFGCGISFTKYRINELNYSTFEYEYDSLLNLGGFSYGGNAGHNYLYRKL